MRVLTAQSKLAGFLKSQDLILVIEFSGNVLRSMKSMSLIIPERTRFNIFRLNFPALFRWSKESVYSFSGASSFLRRRKVQNSAQMLICRTTKLLLWVPSSLPHQSNIFWKNMYLSLAEKDKFICSHVSMFSYILHLWWKTKWWKTLQISFLSVLFLLWVSAKFSMLCFLVVSIQDQNWEAPSFPFPEFNISYLLNIKAAKNFAWQQGVNKTFNV